VYSISRKDLMDSTLLDCETCKGKRAPDGTCNCVRKEESNWANAVRMLYQSKISHYRDEKSTEVGVAA
jgi:hypothetical protein